MQKKDVSMAVIRRIPKYYRYLDELYSKGITRISSRKLAESMGLTASQVRQDFNCFGEFGQQGYGYNVETLRKELSAILGINRRNKAIIIGVGNIGHALLNNFDFDQCGFTILAAFDTNPEIIGTKVNDIEIYNIDKLSEICSKNRIDVAVLTLPKKYAPEMAEKLGQLGVLGIWNFTNIDLKLKNHNVTVEDVHFADSLMTLRFRTGK